MGEVKAFSVDGKSPHSGGRWQREKKKNERHEKKLKKEKGKPPPFYNYDMLRMKIPKSRDAVSHRFFGNCQEQTNTTIIPFHLLEPIKHRAPLWGSDSHSRVWEGVNSNAGRPDMFKKSLESICGMEKRTSVGVNQVKHG